MEQLWQSSNLPFNHQARGSENRTGISVLFWVFLKKENMNPNFLHLLFLFGDTKRLGGWGGSTEKIIHTERATNSTHKHTCAYTHAEEEEKKNKGHH